MVYVETEHRKCIEALKEIKHSYGLTPTQNRYVDKITREELNFQIPKASKRLPDYLNPAEIHALTTVAYNQNPEVGLLAEFLIYTGLRISETRNILIQHIDFYNNQLKVVQGKGHKDRYVPIKISLNNQIRQYIANRGTGYLFAKKDLTAYTIRALQKRMETVIKLCRFDKKLSTHSLRHTFACLCLAKGLRLEDIKLLMGHSSIKTTEIYAKLELGSIKENYLRLMGA